MPYDRESFGRFLGSPVRSRARSSASSSSPRRRAAFIASRIFARSFPISIRASIRPDDGSNLKSILSFDFVEEWGRFFAVPHGDSPRCGFGARMPERFRPPFFRTSTVPNAPREATHKGLCYLGHRRAAFTTTGWFQGLSSCQFLQMFLRCNASANI